MLYLCIALLIAMTVSASTFGDHEDPRELLSSNFQTAITIPLESSGIVVSGLGENKYVGGTVCSVGDVNADGFGDILVLGGSNPWDFETKGAMYLVFGSQFTNNVDLSQLQSTQGVKISGDFNFGEDYDLQTVCSAIGDVNNDDIDDFAIGVTYSGSSGYDGAVYVVFGTTSWSSLDVTSMSSTQGFTIFGAQESGLGWAVSGAGDVNDDGFGDFMIKSAFYNRAFVVFGSASPASFTIDFAGNSVSSRVFVIVTPDGYYYGSTASVGDFNGDGVSDIAVGCSECSEGAGGVYIIFGTVVAANTSLNVDTMTASQGVKIIGSGRESDSNEFGDSSGWAISGAGDVNQDGFSDLLIGVPDKRLVTGMACIIFGSATPKKEIHLSTMTHSQGIFLFGENAGDHAGYALSSGGDINGDGYDDVIIGAMFGNDDGTVYVVFGASRLVNIHLESMSSDVGVAIVGSSLSRAGITVSGGYDINQDGFADIVIGAPYSKTDAGSNVGGVYIVYGSDSLRSEIYLSSLTSVNALFAPVQSQTFVSFVPSVTSKKPSSAFVDLLIGVPSSRSSKGEVVLLFGNSYGFRNLRNLSSVTSSEGITITGASIGDFCGNAVSSAGDMNGDGYQDFVFGCYGASDYHGEVYVIFGNKTLSSLHLNHLGTASTKVKGFKVTMKTYIGYPNLGTAVSNIGDFNGDGYDDIAVTAKFSNTDNWSTGTLFVIYGGETSTLTSFDVSNGMPDATRGFGLYETTAYAYMGVCVSSIGDFNADGFDDLVVGGSTVSYIIFGSASLPGYLYTSDLSNVSITGSIIGVSLKNEDAIDGGYNIAYAASGAGDVNQDGFSDVVITEPWANFYDGAVYVIFGSDNPSSTIDLTSLSILSGTGYIINGALGGEELFGWSIGSVDDYNSDGIPDLIIAVPARDAWAGGAYIIYGQSTLDVISVSHLSDAQGLLYAGETFSQAPGWSVAGVTDTSGNFMLAMGTDAAQNSDTPEIPPFGAVYVVAPADPATATTYAPTPLPSAVPSFTPTTVPTFPPTTLPTTTPTAKPSDMPTCIPSPMPSTIPSANPTSAPTAAPTAVPSAEPTSAAPTFVPTISPTPDPTHSPTTLWHREQGTILGFAIPFATATLPLCFSAQLCAMAMDKFGVSNIDENNNDIISIIAHNSNDRVNIENPWYIELFRAPCDWVYASSYKQDKLLLKDFQEKYYRQVDQEDATAFDRKDNLIGEGDVEIGPVSSSRSMITSEEPEFGPSPPTQKSSQDLNGNVGVTTEAETPQLVAFIQPLGRPESGEQLSSQQLNLHDIVFDNAPLNRPDVVVLLKEAIGHGDSNQFFSSLERPSGMVRIAAMESTSFNAGADDIIIVTVIQHILWILEHSCLLQFVGKQLMGVSCQLNYLILFLLHALLGIVIVARPRGKDGTMRWVSCEQGLARSVTFGGQLLHFSLRKEIFGNLLSFSRGELFQTGEFLFICTICVDCFLFLMVQCLLERKMPVVEGAKFCKYLLLTLSSVAANCMLLSSIGKNNNLVCYGAVMWAAQLFCSGAWLRVLKSVLTMERRLTTIERMQVKKKN